jgi:hypothetical protein
VAYARLSMKYMKHCVLLMTLIALAYGTGAVDVLTRTRNQAFGLCGRYVLVERYQRPIHDGDVVAVREKYRRQTRAESR